MKQIYIVKDSYNQEPNNLAVFSTLKKANTYKEALISDGISDENHLEILEKDLNMGTWDY